MKYIIDANNLAGEMGLLDFDDFDKILIEKIAGLTQKKNYVLVFDSLNYMGDRFQQENLEIIYAPRDEFYGNADAKILEIVKQEKDCFLISNDLDLIEKAKNKNKNLKQISCKQFAQKFKKVNTERESNVFEQEELDSLNKELYDLWT